MERFNDLERVTSASVFSRENQHYLLRHGFAIGRIDAQGDIFRISIWQGRIKENINPTCNVGDSEATLREKLGKW